MRGRAGGGAVCVPRGTTPGRSPFFGTPAGGGARGASGAALADAVAEGTLADPTEAELAGATGAIGGRDTLAGGSELTAEALGRGCIATATTPATATASTATTLNPTRSGTDPVFARGTSRSADTAGAAGAPAASLAAISVSANEAADSFAPGEDIIADRAAGETGERGSIDSGSVVEP